jgi:hypothetical protein
MRLNIIALFLITISMMFVSINATTCRLVTVDCANSAPCEISDPSDPGFCFCNDIDYLPAIVCEYYPQSAFVTLSQLRIAPHLL